MPNAKSSLNELLGRVVQQVVRLLKGDGASIFLLEGDDLVLKATTRPDVGPARYKIGQGITGAVFTHRKEFWGKMPDQGLFTNEELKSKYDEIESPASRVGSLVAVPLIDDHSKVVGVLRCTSHVGKTAFAERDVESLKIIAETVSSAISAQQQLDAMAASHSCFVLMPFAAEFDDIYQLGMKPVLHELGFRCERVDEIQHNDSILDRIYRGIQSADIVLADMTGKNPNVFYEVGYAHALRKEVIHLTQRSEDIPFDLKHRNHIVYGTSISNLRSRLKPRLEAWLESANGEQSADGNPH